MSNIHDLYEAYLASGKVITDTRKLEPESIYFALKGQHFDGNNFAKEALSSGCRLAVVDDERLKNEKGCFWVPNALKMLQNLARYHREKLSIPVIGITGSNGKTTTKELIAAVLKKKYNVWYTQGNLNNHIGVPLTILSMPPQTQVAIIEMGANHIGEIAGLCQIAKPNHGLITNIGKAHLEGFGSFNGVKKGKGELYDFLKKTGGEIFVNVDNPDLLEMLGDYPWIGYGSGSKAVVRAEEISASPMLSFNLTTSRVSGLRINTHLIGKYNKDNVLAAASVAHYFGVEESLVKAALEEYVPKNNRSQFLNTGRNHVILDAYNANPSSMQVALSNFKEMEHPFKVIILGSMKELGEDSKKEHYALLTDLEKLDVEVCFLIGEEFKGIIPANNRFKWYKDTKDLQEALKAASLNNALVLVKGSRANELETVVDFL
ncbi:UDP-N-acetylmuramoyl-tripeptide--D-alanyl-D-alanine ligase [Thermophagus xiamenensis]|jgi:UDP-N-acetylmuramoyl-tripeptide--D-alanyl-D-alanine ligase|uniref:UDP-N-acetylmuramoyl-tripeptide--D-alanyl-D-alanine ligase n=1 Tax=Thermophagus xiamenensis TaxID=385682 RepID=A0A1I2C8G2_9BACT|nr:UDP-N-acetylmuramoyl-tripeptide--D-alanyl-D-alanine ligase [Thermophagus xiamenensis]SFE64498.1 UDP-N-acetylmuramoyl-tripeptide--D-alanyl-D-alanine ligase [Thermophagus xiamenensis]